MGYRALLFVCLSVLAIVSASMLDEDDSSAEEGSSRCFTCHYGFKDISGDQMSEGSPYCIRPRYYAARIEHCSGTCYTVHVEDEENDITYVQRGCLPGCRHNENYNVMDYGKGSMRCCVGDLCNHATGLRVSHIALATVAMVLGFFIFH